jgi:hypothetical protein
MWRSRACDILLCVALAVQKRAERHAMECR